MKEKKMENSMASMSKSLSSKTRTSESPEESSWTFYFDDFSNEEQSPFCSGYGNTSLLSDASSSSAVVVKKNDQAMGFSWDKSSQRLSFKKRRTREAKVDEALEDTASSPVNSPKVSSYISHLNMNLQKDDNTDSSMKKSGTSGHKDESSEVGIAERDSEFTELKKRGLCLVPVSLFTNYLG